MPEQPLVRDPEVREALQMAAEKDLQMIYGRMGGLNQDQWSDCAAFRAVNNSRMPAFVLPWQPQISVFASWVRAQWAELDVRDGIVAPHSPEVLDKMQNKWHPLHTSEYLWTKSMLPNNLLTCLGDRAEMAHSMEGRLPFLDHQLVEYVNRLPPSVKISYDSARAPPERDQGPFWVGVGTAREVLSEKWILKEAGKPFITQELYERKKHPYMAPIKWKRGGPISRMLETVLTREAVEDLGFVDWKAVEDGLSKAFGESADPRSFRVLLMVASWVVIGQRFKIKKMGESEYLAFSRGAISSRL